MKNCVLALINGTVVVTVVIVTWLVCFIGGCIAAPIWRWVVAFETDRSYPISDEVALSHTVTFSPIGVVIGLSLLCLFITTFWVMRNDNAEKRNQRVDDFLPLMGGIMIVVPCVIGMIATGKFIFPMIARLLLPLVQIEGMIALYGCVTSFTYLRYLMFPIEPDSSSRQSANDQPIKHEIDDDDDGMVHRMMHFGGTDPLPKQRGALDAEKEDGTRSKCMLAIQLTLITLILAILDVHPLLVCTIGSVTLCIALALAVKFFGEVYTATHPYVTVGISDLQMGSYEDDTNGPRGGPCSWK